MESFDGRLPRWPKGDGAVLCSSTRANAAKLVQSAADSPGSSWAEQLCHEQQHLAHTFSLAQHLLNHFPMHVGQPAVDAVVAESQSFMINSQQVQDRRVQIVAIGWVGGPP